MAFTSKGIPDLEDKDPIADFKTWADLMVGQSGGYGVPGQYKQLMGSLMNNISLGNSPMIQVPPNNNSINYPWSKLVDEEEL